MVDLTDTQIWAREIESRARNARITINELCTKAEITRPSFHRWKRGAGDPTVPSMRKVEAVLDKAEADRP